MGGVVRQRCRSRKALVGFEGDEGQGYVCVLTILPS